jgi:hypothetical protein
MADRKPIVSDDDASKRVLERVLVLGAGNFGTCLAEYVSQVLRVCVLNARGLCLGSSVLASCGHL